MDKMLQDILELFKVMVVEDSARCNANTQYIDRGLVLDFNPTPRQLTALKKVYKPLDVTTMFSREERDNADPFDLITKQIMHYVEVYGLGMPGLFNLEVTTDQIVTMNYIRAVDKVELGIRVRELLYANAPVKDANVVRDIIDAYDVEYDINSVANNELRVILFDARNDTFESGDDVVRYLCYLTTDSTLLIKSKEVIEAVRLRNAKVPLNVLSRHVLPLAQVFNRHKRLILAVKNEANCTVINRISRLSKTQHVPVRESVNKIFIAKALNNDIDLEVLDRISVRDKFKYLNLFAYKRERLELDAFVIRNGKVHFEQNRRVYKVSDISRVEKAVLESLKKDLADLADKKILLDGVVRYGLPISRKQTVGQLPFGTCIAVEGERISSGIYWENEWGATDLDLSTIDPDGKRTGWGMYSGYDRKNPVTYSGDVTYAQNGAMEFMTSGGPEYGLFVNIYCGETGCGMELVVGEDSDGSKWIDKPIIREKMQLNSRQLIIGFVRGTDFVIYTGRLGSNRVIGSGRNPMVARGMANFWTVNALFDKLKIEYAVDKDEKIDYDYELGYEGFSLDKLEELLIKK